MHHRNHTTSSVATNGTAAIATPPGGIPDAGGTPYRAGGAGQRPAQAPDNVVELYPGRRPPRTEMGIRLRASEAGMATAEYAIATLAAVGFAGLLVFILRSDEVRGFLLNLIRTALALP
ncbi:DUF4244 domain-containing protein [Arthrobacter sp. C152]